MHVVREMIYNYNLGNETYFASQMSYFNPSEEELPAIPPQTIEAVKKNLFSVRNRRMAERIRDAILASNDTAVVHMFALGAGHFLGDDEDNVVDLLRNDGFKVRRILPEQRNLIFNDGQRLSFRASFLVILPYFVVLFGMIN